MVKRTRQNKDKFEIAFYEGVLEKSPKFVEALAALGDLYTKKGRVAEGLVVDERLSEIRPQDPIVLYNLACSYSLMERVDDAFDNIRKAIHCGYDDVEFLSFDEDLSNLRKDKRFIIFLEILKEQKISGSSRNFDEI